MHKIGKNFFVIFTILLIPSLLYPAISATQVEAADGPYPKIGFTWINGIVGASELIEPGYQKAVEIGAQLEHRDYRWGYLSSTIDPVYEWKKIFVERFEGLEASIAIGVIDDNYTSFPSGYNYSRYLTIPLPSANITRFNDPLIIEELKNTTDVILGDIGNFSYISFGNNINSFFETYFDYTSKNMTSTAMLSDYADLCEQMYDYVKANYPEVKVLTIFRNQIAIDSFNIEGIIDWFNNSCDIYAMNGRIFTTEDGFLEYLTETEIIQRFKNFIDLTGTKKFAITNTFTISASSASGSEAYQANYIHTLFKLVNQYSDKMEFLCWYRFYDFPPGYLGMIYNPYLEAQRTSGLLTCNGDHKLGYFAWIEEMEALNRIPTYTTTWKTVVYSLSITVIGGFIIYAIVMEGIEFYNETKEPKEEIDEIDFGKESDTKVQAKKKKEKKPKMLEFTVTDEDLEESEPEE